MRFLYGAVVVPEENKSPGIRPVISYQAALARVAACLLAAVRIMIDSLKLSAAGVAVENRGLHAKVSSVKLGDVSARLLAEPRYVLRQCIVEHLLD